VQFNNCRTAIPFTLDIYDPLHPDHFHEACTNNGIIIVTDSTLRLSSPNEFYFTIYIHVILFAHVYIMTFIHIIMHLVLNETVQF